MTTNLINKQLFDFETDAYRQGEFIKVKREDDLGKWSVFFFYPADFTFVCPTELEDLQDHYQAFQDIGCEIFSVSEDSHFVHKAWADATPTIGDIQYTMLADQNGQIARFFGVLDEEKGQAYRGSFVMNPRGEIKAYEVHDMGIGRDASELLRKVQAAMFVEEHGDLVCPAKWHPGEKTLEPGIDLVGKI